MNIKVDFDNIVVKEDKNDFNVKVLMLKGEKGEAGATNWGAITGTLSNQTDLKNALDGKANQSDFNTVSGQVNTNTSNISTINGQITDINGELDDFEDLFYGNATVNDENTSITLENTIEAKFEKIDLKGNTSQTGTPTPTSPIPVNVVSGDNEIVVCGKNLFNGTIYKENYVISSTGAESYNSNFNLYKMNLKPNTTYTIQFKSTDTVARSSRYIAYKSNDTFIEMIFDFTYDANESVTKTFTTPNETSYILFHIGKLEENIQVEQGSSTSTYEPYQGNTYNIDLPEGMELCKIENQDHTIKYQDYIYKDSDKWYLYKAIGKVILNGSETIQSYTTSVSGHFRYFFDAIGIKRPSGSGELPLVLCNRYVAQILGMAGSWGAHQGISVDTGGDKIVINDDTYYAQDSSAYKTWLQSNNVLVYYALATPTTIEITDTTLISQLNALEQATSKNGETNISQVNDDLPFIMYAEAFANTFNGRMEGMDYKIDNCEVLNNKVTSITSGSTDSEYPSAKAVYDLFNSITDGDEVSY